MSGWMNYKLESRLLGEIPITLDIPLIAEYKEELKSLLMKMKEESEKASLELNIKKKKIRSWHLVPSLHGKWKRKRWKQ